MFLHWIKVKTELENGISYTTVKEQWESNSALKLDKLVTSLLRKWPLNVLVNLLESPSALFISSLLL